MGSVWSILKRQEQDDPNNFQTAVLQRSNPVVYDPAMALIIHMQKDFFSGMYANAISKLIDEQGCPLGNTDFDKYKDCVKGVVNLFRVRPYACFDEQLKTHRWFSRAFRDTGNRLVKIQRDGHLAPMTVRHCYYCKENFDSETSFIRHMDSIHLVPRPNQVTPTPNMARLVL